MKPNFTIPTQPQGWLSRHGQAMLYGFVIAVYNAVTAADPQATSPQGRLPEFSPYKLPGVLLPAGQLQRGTGAEKAAPAPQLPLGLWFLDPQRRLDNSPFGGRNTEAKPAPIPPAGGKLVLPTPNLDKLLNEFPPAPARQKVVWHEFDEMYGRLFPSLILAQSAMDLSDVPLPPLLLGDRPNSSFTATVQAPRAGAVIRLELSCDDIMEPSVEEVRAEKAMEYGILPHIRWKVDKLLKNIRTRKVTLVWKLSVDGGEADIRTREMTLEPMDVMPTRYASEFLEGIFIYHPLFAAFVNEDHPGLQAILDEALATNVVASFPGKMSANPDDNVRQVFAIWWALQKRGIIYADDSIPPNPHDKHFASQRVRLLDDVIREKEANCIDGTILLASLLKKIGITPIICTSPGHAYLAFYIDSKNQDFVCLETTALNHRGVYLEAQRAIAKRGELPSEDLSKARDDDGGRTCPDKARDAQAMFEIAMQLGGENTKRALEALKTDPKAFFYFVNVQEAREKMHIRPIKGIRP